MNTHKNKKTNNDLSIIGWVLSRAIFVFILLEITSFSLGHLDPQMIGFIFLLIAIVILLPAIFRASGSRESSLEERIEKLA
ncbi:MAG: hypothetical protein HXY49_11035 [Ignavibacteriaceae bacterium]|jgi:hypothetical protein|nr:hypothetical protein [Ignavibacteriaceae bacterium]